MIVTDAACGGTLEIPFDASSFSASTTITNDYWGCDSAGRVRLSISPNRTTAAK